MKIKLFSWSDFLSLSFNQDGFWKLIKELWRDAKLRWFLLSALFFNLIIWAASLFINLKSRDEVIALHHNIYFGITLIGDPKNVYFIPFMGLMAIIFNLILANIIKKEENAFMLVFSVCSLIVNIFLFLGITSIVLINFR
ncbi:MAG: hypothetical protein WC323_01325 [Patescibacteria group bacterium]|jgi:hypothetical protein